MAKRFPELGDADEYGHCGMYIAEDHDEIMHSLKLLHAWPTIGYQIDVLFLESFGAGEQIGRSVGQINAQLRAGHAPEAADWKKYQQLYPHRAQIYLQLTRLAKHSNTQVLGLAPLPFPQYMMLPKFSAILAMDDMLESQGYHEVWRECIRANLLKLRVRRYAVYGGNYHGPQLKKLLPNLTCYALEGEEYREYVAIDHRARCTWAA